MSVTNDDPRTVKEAVDSEDGKLWKEAMVDEMASLHKNEAWDLVELLAGRKPIGSKWVFKKKTNAEGKVEKYKARLVAKGYSQVPGIDFGDIFSLVAKVTSIRLLLSVAAAFDFEVEQMDVKTAFLHGDLEEEIYMKQPEGFAVKGKKELASKLKKSLYGLKQSPGMWYQKFDTFIRGLGFTRSKADHCVHFKLIGDHGNRRKNITKINSRYLGITFCYKPSFVFLHLSLCICLLLEHPFVANGFPSNQKLHQILSLIFVQRCHFINHGVFLEFPSSESIASFIVLGSSLVINKVKFE